VAAPLRGRVGFWLYAAHLYALVGIAASNVLAGLTLLSAPWTAQAARAAPVPLPAPLAAARRALVSAVGLYVVFLLVSIAASYDPRTSLRATSELFTLATLGLGLVLVRGERAVRRVVDGLVAVGALAAIWGLAQTLFGYGELDRRIRGPFSHWMTFAGFLLVCDLLLAAYLLFPPDGRRSRADGAADTDDRPSPADRDPPSAAVRNRILAARAWRWAAFAAINAALVVSLTRSVWVALAAALVVAVGLRKPRALVLGPAAALVFVLAAPVPLVARALSIADLSDPSNYDRLCMAEAGLHMIAERPLTGLGPEMVERRYPIYRPPTAPRYTVPHLHDTFLQLAAERGLPALAAYLAMVAAALAAAWIGFRREGGRTGPRADLWLGALLALVAFNVAGLFENNWGDTEVQRLVLFVMALPFCLGAPGSSAAPAEAARPSS